MYADRLRRRRIDPVGVAGAALVGGAMIGALIFVVPQIVPGDAITRLPIRDYKDPPPPPPEPTPTPHPRVKPDALPEPQPTAPDPIVVADPRPVEFVTVREPVFPVVVEPRPGAGAAVAPPPPAFVDAAADPRYADDFQPPYPASEIRSGAEGRITVRVQIGADGRVKAVEPVGGGNAAFFEATRRQALSRWRFRPATRGGVPVETWKTMTVRFQLTE